MAIKSYPNKTAYSQAVKSAIESQVSMIETSREIIVDGVNVITTEPVPGDLLFLDESNNKVYIKGGAWIQKANIPAAWTHVGYVYMRREDEETAEICAIISKMNDEMAKKAPSYSVFIDGYAKILLGMLKRHKKISTIDIDYDALAKLAPVFNYVEEHLSEDITLEDAAETLQMNREYFCRIFKRITTLTFIDYLNIVRTNRAAERLITTDDSISEIAESTGFSSVSYFTRVFKNITKFTPASHKNIKLL